ncbi:Mex67p [Sugiyamaella lignohabitans]|uniref:mRNA export factor MEX67 n=1 Tax=Sugiyamaella lignohabitans TaxID=796027 RepID=A0A167CLE9_9ASCO|nr:Mex67p [Sugiyamaella lignohabitans]ANB11850.1 Mex67p [Sugiyamaella lignohabitans]
MSWRGGRGRGNSSNNNYNNGGDFGSRLGGTQSSGFGSGGSSHNNNATVEIRGWEGGTRDDLVAFILRKCSIKLQNVIVNGGVISAGVKQEEAGPLVKWSGVRFAGAPLRITIVESNKPSSASNPPTYGTVEILRNFLQSRYNAQISMLDLQNLKNDVYLQQNGLFASASTASKMFPALMKIAGELASGQQRMVVESVNLAANELQEVTGVTTLAQAFPDLKNLSLANNNITRLKGLEPWRHKFRLLRELILSGNPVTEQPGYKEEMMKMFPRLIMLDGQMIRDESTLDQLKLPLPVKQMFFENPDVQGIATSFLTNFFNAFDHDRAQLAQLYDETSTFSISVNSSSPRVMPGGGTTAPSQAGWSAYIPLSRNLQKVTTESARINRLAIGPQAILNAFRRIPPTKHPLMESPDKFAVETWHTNGVRAADDTGIMISIHGEFSEQQTNTVRSFDRTFILIQGPAGNMIVASDIMTVRSWGGSESWKESVLPPPTVPTTVPGVNTPSAGAGGVNGIPPPAPTINPMNPSAPPPIMATGTPPTVNTPPELADLPPPQLAIVQQLMQETRLTPQYSRMLAEQANFDLNQAAVLFQQSRQQLPPSAFL